MQNMSFSEYDWEVVSFFMMEKTVLFVKKIHGYTLSTPNVSHIYAKYIFLFLFTVHGGVL